MTIRASIEIFTTILPVQASSVTDDFRINAVYIPPESERDVDHLLHMAKIVVNSKPQDNHLILGDFNLLCVIWCSNCLPTFVINGTIEVQNAGIRLIED